MSSNNAAEEIADDFRHSLEYLQTPDRYAINNFTVIAKENTEHADAISNVLVEHIRKAPPHYKLPALYVLDSIAKNIGTPYSLFLGHKLYGVFMESYSSVDTATRKKLDEMLRTWKSPVPGSIDPTPVFPPEITRKIESALIQARTAVLKHDQQLQQPSTLQRRPVSAMAMAQWRNTPDPQQQAMQPPAILNQKYGQQLGAHMAFVGTTMSPDVFLQQQLHPQPPFQPLSAVNDSRQQGHDRNFNSGSLSFLQQPTNTDQHHQSFNLQQPQSPDLAVLHRDIDQLITNCKPRSGGDQFDPHRTNKVQALLALKDVLSKQSLPYDQLILVRRQVDGLQAADQREGIDGERPASALMHTNHPGQVVLNGIQSSIPPLQHTYSTTPSMYHISPPSNLSTLLAKANGKSFGAVVDAQGTAATSSASSPSPLPGQTSPINVSSVLASLTNSGILARAAAPASAPPITTMAKPTSVASVAELLARATGANSYIRDEKIFLSSASLKIPRPSLNKQSLAARPSQCVNCGLRFTLSAEGIAKKARHMDWHFRANQRIQDAAKGIQSRSWFVGDLEWIKSRMLEDHSDSSEEIGVSRAHSETALDGPTAKYISVPSDPELHQPCPICQERFDTGFNQEIQDWVWLDAVRLGAKIYHATCVADLRRDEQELRDKTNTPDSILGKRKGEYSSMESPMKKSMASN